MSQSPFPLLRQCFQALKRLTFFIFYADHASGQQNPNWSVLHYAPPSQSDSQKCTEIPSSALHPLSLTHDCTLTADVVIIGSGSGGSVIASELAAAGEDVIVIERGAYYRESDFSGDEFEMTAKLYLRHGLMATSDHSLLVVAGSCLGGGTVVNWCTSLRTPDHILEEWEHVHALQGVAGVDYQRSFTFLENRLSVTTGDSIPNANNAVLQQGCTRLHYHWDHLPRNAMHCQQRCGGCSYGCRYGRKQSTVSTFLQDAEQRGARILVNCTAERVLLSGDAVTGVVCQIKNEQEKKCHRVTICAPRVVVAAGALESPALLLRSGLTNPHIGRHLHLHPVAMMMGQYQQRIESWHGSIQTIFSEQFADRGIRFEVAPLHPGMYGLMLPWNDGWSHKQLMERIAHFATFVVMLHDTSEGRVRVDKQGQPLISYWLNARDRRHLLYGTQECTHIALASGAIGIETLYTPRIALEVPEQQAGSVSARDLETFLQRISRRGIAANRLPLFSAHQMGTCRLGKNAQTAVANPFGEVYGVRGLFIGDASGFPTAVGVNPMLSIMAFAYRVAQYMKSHR